MLAIPSKGFYKSVKVHNGELDVFCDWAEANVLFEEEELSSKDIVDVLIEEHLYYDQDFASQMVMNVWNELRRRASWIGAMSPYSFEKRRIKRAYAWEDVPAHSFCVLLALTKVYPKWATGFGDDYNEQGEIFELLTKESLENQFLGWKIYKTGWSRTNAVKLKEVVDEVTDRLGEIKGQMEPWANPNANESGLDLLCYRPFPDNRAGLPVYLMQCASGRNWKDKLHTPDLSVWTKMIQFAAPPTKAFSTPFAFLDDDFANTSNIVKGLLLDRYRLLAAYQHKKNWISQELKDRIVRWAEPKINNLPRGDE